MPSGIYCLVPLMRQKKRKNKNYESYVQRERGGLKVAGTGVSEQGIKASSETTYTLYSLNPGPRIYGFASMLSFLQTIVIRS